MDGLFLRLLEDKTGAPGRWFWPCFKPLRGTFTSHRWIFNIQPWMGAPSAFDFERELAEFDAPDTSMVMLWRPTAIGRWADQFAEEYIELWAPKPTENPAGLAAQFARIKDLQIDAFIEEHGAIWLIYTDSTSWEVFAQDSSLLETLRDYLEFRPAIKVYDTSSLNRRSAFQRAGVGHMYGR